MLASTLQARRQLKKMPIIDAWRGDSGHERRLPFRQSSRLVEGNGADPVRRLERLGVFDENARPSGNAGARHDSRGGSKAKRAGRSEESRVGKECVGPVK